MLDIARAVVISRQTRKEFFASSIFGEPAWDMLLTLYVADREGMPVTVGRLAQLSDARLTTAIRWIEYLEQSGLVERRDHPHDARVVLIELTEPAVEKIEAYFRALLDAGMGLQTYP
jgi:DNA-binding MarR family transcriptional regulator